MRCQSYLLDNKERYKYLPADFVHNVLSVNSIGAGHGKTSVMLCTMYERHRP